MLTPSQKRSIFNGFTAFFGGFEPRIPLHEPLRNLRPQRSFCAQKANSLTHMHQAVFYTAAISQARR